MSGKSTHFAYSQLSESVIPDRAEITVQTRAFTDFIAEMRTIFPSWE
jgi:hypothetical protein